MSKQTPPVPTVSAIGPCTTIIQIVGRPGIGSLPRTIASPDYPPSDKKSNLRIISHIFPLLVGWLFWV